MKHGLSKVLTCASLEVSNLFQKEAKLKCVSCRWCTSNAYTKESALIACYVPHFKIRSVFGSCLLFSKINE